MPCAIVYTIQPSAPRRVPSSLARATYAAILRLIQAADPALAARVHDDEGRKPLTVSNVLGLGAGRFSQADPEHDYGLRVTLLSPELEALAAGWTPEAIGAIELDGEEWRVLARADTADAHPWAGAASYEDLAAPLLERQRDPPGRWELQFASAVTFRRRGVNIPMPMPELVFGSLLEKWNAFAPIALPDELRRYAEECIAVSRYELRSAAGPSSGGVVQIGGLGRCLYVATTQDRYWRAGITALARYAFYSGVGAVTTRGFGQARLVG